MNILERLKGFLVGEDEAVNALGGGQPTQTISGTIGRGVIAGRWWATSAAFVVDGLFGQGHCARQAAKEAGAA
jgi:hypothetical protein